MHNPTSVRLPSRRTPLFIASSYQQRHLVRFVVALLAVFALMLMPLAARADTIDGTDDGESLNGTENSDPILEWIRQRVDEQRRGPEVRVRRPLSAARAVRCPRRPYSTGLLRSGIGMMVSVRSGAAPWTAPWCCRSAGHSQWIAVARSPAPGVLSRRPLRERWSPPLR